MEPNGAPGTRELAGWSVVIVVARLSALFMSNLIYASSRRADRRTDRQMGVVASTKVGKCATMKTQQFVVGNVNSREINCAHTKYAQIAGVKMRRSKDVIFWTFHQANPNRYPLNTTKEMGIHWTNIQCLSYGNF